MLTVVKAPLKILSMVALSSLFLLFSCKDDEPEICENGTFIATINGKDMDVVSFNNTLVKGKDVAVIGMEGKRIDIRAWDADGKQLVIIIRDVSTGKNGDGVSTDEYASFYNVIGGNNYFHFVIIEDGVSYPFYDGTLDVTSCDSAKKKISGTFSFSDGNFEVTNGSFTNMCYAILE